MKPFLRRIIKPFILENGYKHICEIGARKGGNTDGLLKIPEINVSVIDPCLDADLCAKYKDIDRVRVFKGRSLEVLRGMRRKFDCILIDGDHNWYTVYNELEIIRERELLESGGAIFLHDVGWPWGRRDMYYSPENIPGKYRQPYAKKGIVRGMSGLSETSTVLRHVNKAVREGGSRNGVLTAIEDFMRKNKRGYMFFVFGIGHGLGVIVKNKDFITAIRSIKWIFKTTFHKVFIK